VAHCSIVTVVVARRCTHVVIKRTLLDKKVPSNKNQPRSLLLKDSNFLKYCSFKSVLNCYTRQKIALNHTLKANATLYFSKLRYFTLLYATLRYSTLLYATLRYSTLLYATLRYSTLLYATLRYSTLLMIVINILKLLIAYYFKN
jgi:uncharacterized protein YjbI with pentapeptide repeats